MVKELNIIDKILGDITIKPGITVNTNVNSITFNAIMKNGNRKYIAIIFSYEGQEGNGVWSHSNFIAGFNKFQVTTKGSLLTTSPSYNSPTKVIFQSRNLPDELGNNEYNDMLHRIKVAAKVYVNQD
jgi:ABC-type thiamine transport system ATPase subunit